MNHARATDADIVLLLEGTYPYVRGGVSSWVHQIIGNTPHRSFHLVFLGGDRNARGEIKYALPDNVVALEEHYLFPPADVPFRPRRGNREAFERWTEFQRYFHAPNRPVPRTLLLEMLTLLDEPTAEGIGEDDFLYSEAAWRSLVETNLEFYPEIPFTQFFWTYRNLYRPLLLLARIAKRLPRARIYHSVSTGYAGFLGAGVSLLNGAPLLVSEHGIYTKERFIDISQAEWIIEEKPLISHSLTRTMGDLRRIWIRFFEQLGTSTYEVARRITALYEGNRLRQLKDGAPAPRTLVIPNGIDLARFESALAARVEGRVPPVAALIGRVVPIKDIKTFIRAIVQAGGELPELEGWVIGPFEEDEGYHKECLQLVESLGVQDRVKFLGMQNVAEILPRIGVSVLTSISEAQPLVLLEGMAAGVPFVATDVGSCREIALGLREDDQKLGVAGEIVPIASPGRTAEAIVRMLSDPARWARYQAAGLARVRVIYDEKLMYERFHALYAELG